MVESGVLVQKAKDGRVKRGLEKKNKGKRRGKKQKWRWRQKEEERNKRTKLKEVMSNKESIEQIVGIDEVQIKNMNRK